MLNRGTLLNLTLTVTVLAFVMKSMKDIYDKSHACHPSGKGYFSTECVNAKSRVSSDLLILLVAKLLLVGKNYFRQQRPQRPQRPQPVVRPTQPARRLGQS